MSQTGNRPRTVVLRRPPGHPSLAKVFRVADWWSFKLTPPLALFFGTLVATGQPLMPRWLDMVTLIGAIAICAAYVSLINDVFDREEDARSGKRNPLADVPPRASRILMLALPVAGAALASAWGGEPTVLLLYAASWIAFTAYSAPPFRLKTRGWPGIVADAAGATVFPVLLAVTLAGRSSASGPDPLWIAAAAAWATGWGLRGILWHQLADAERDRAGSVRTFVQRSGPRAATLVGRYVALPLELSALALLLAKTGSVLPVIFLVLYLGVLAGRSKLWRASGGRALVLDEYYDGLLPLAMIAASALRHPSDWLLLIPFFILFGRRPTHVLHHALRLFWDLVQRSRASAVAALRRIVRGPVRRG